MLIKTAMKVNVFKNIVFIFTTFLLSFYSSSSWALDNKILALQSKLEMAGYDPGPIDGLWGQKTARAASQMLSDNGLDEAVDRQNLDAKNLMVSLNNAFNKHSEITEKSYAHLQNKVDVFDARHLLERSGIGAHPKEILELIGLSRSEAITRVLGRIDGTTVANAPPGFSVSDVYPDYWIRWDYDETDRQTFRISRDQEMGEFRNWWVREMLTTPNPQAERLILLWHNHFVTAYSGVQEEVHAIAKQHFTFRELGHTNFRTLAKAMIHDAALLNYLDNDRSRKEQPNENLARELMELFMLGEGNYSEQDVKEVARALTGYGYNNLRNLEFEFKPWDHDRNTKTILGKRGKFKGNDVVDILLSQPAAAEHIVKKFWKVYISEFNFAPDEISRMSEVFRTSEYDIVVLLRSILASEHFWSVENRQTIVKSPVDIIIGSLRATGNLPNWWPTIPNRLSTLGQNLFEAPNVAGWPGGADWITPSRLLLRNEAIESLSDADAIDSVTKTKINDGPREKNVSMMSIVADQPRTALVRYAAENFQGPPSFTLAALSSHQGPPKVVWRSDVFHAENGIDTEKFGRVEPQDLQWSTAQFELPENISYDRLRLNFLNDKCCGPGGSDGGDRNLFIAWVAIDDKFYDATAGKQKTCSNGDADRNPGRMYCTGWLDLTDFQALNYGEFEKSNVDTAQNDAFTVERVAFEWGEKLDQQDGWSALTLGLLNPQFKDIQSNAINIHLVLNKTDRGKRILLSLEDRACYPTCLGAALPKSAYHDKESGNLEVNFIISGHEWREEKSQWSQLSAEQREFISVIWSNMPKLLEMATQGRNWRERNGEGIYESWSKVIAEIERLLPKSRYFKLAKNRQIELRTVEKANYMMSMMSGFLDQTPDEIAGVSTEKANWKIWVETEPDLSLKGLLMSANMQSLDIGTPSLKSFMMDPSYNLK